MKRILLSTALTLALTGPLMGPTAFALQTQQPTLPENSPSANAPFHHGHHAPNPQRQAERISKQLNLSADQTAKLTPIFAARDQKFQEMQQNTSLTPEQRHEQMKAIHQSTEQQLAAVLTPDQMQQLKSMHHNHHRNGPNSPNGNNPAPPQTPPTGL